MHPSTTDRSNRSRETRLLAYTFVAGAAALHGQAQTADATVQYSGVQDLAIALGNSQDLNIDGDAYNDILLKNYVFTYGNYQGAYVNFSPGKFVGFNDADSGFNYVSALTSGVMVDSSNVNYFVGSMSYGVANPNGQFDSVTDAYIGLAFPIAAVNHYGWIRVSIDNAAGTFVINDWAYEDQPGVGILTGDMVGSTAIPGDLNGDGYVGLDDLQPILDHWNQNVTVGDATMGDIAGPNGTAPDGYVGLDDLQPVLDHWNEGTLPTPPSIVPEPGALSLLAAGAGGLCFWRKRR